MSIHELNPNIYMSDAALDQFRRLHTPAEIAAPVVRHEVVVQYDGTEGADHAPSDKTEPNEHWANMIP